MKKTLLLCSFLLALVSLSASLAPLRTAAQEPEIPRGGETPTVLVEEGVTTFALVPPRIHWNTSPECIAIPESPATLYEDGPEIISRIATHGGLIRELLRVDEVPDECTPYAILSNLIADEAYVYWVDDTGLVRLPISANVGNPPELVSEELAPYSFNYPVELTDAGDAIYASAHNLNTTYTLWHVDKSSQVATPILSRSGQIANLSFDGEYLYWLDHSNGFDGLYRTEKTPTGYNHLILGVEVTGYHAEGLWEFCLVSCVETHYVFIAHGDHVDRYNNLTGSLTQDIYVSDSTEPGAVVYEMVTDFTNLFILEERPTGTLKVRDYLLLRTGRIGGEVDYLYAHTNHVDHPPRNLRTDDEYLYWIETYGAEAGQTHLLTLPNNADAMPLTNLFIDDMRVTQGIQTPENDIFLIRERRTFVQVFAQAETGLVPGVTATLHRLDESGNVIGTTYPINKNSIYLTLLPVENQDSLQGNFLFEVPLAWTTTTPLRLRAVLNPANKPLELDTDRADNVWDMTLPLLPSPRLEVDFFVLTYGYTEDNIFHSFTPDMERDVLQTFDWIVRTYPLASTPGDATDPTPGFRPNLIEINMEGALWSRVMQTHWTCYVYFEEDDRSLCASTYVNNYLKSLKYITQSANVFYGLMSDEAKFPRGSGSSAGVASGPAGDFCCGSSAWDADQRYTDWYTAHEIGHAVGRGHPLEGAEICEHKPKDFAYPHDDALIGSPSNPTIGFDAGFPMFGVPKQLLPYAYWADFMSYCANQWISDYTYEEIYEALFVAQTRPLQAAPAGAELLGVYGLIIPNAGLADLQIIQQFDTGATIPPLVPGNYSIRLRNAAGNLLADYPFNPEDDEYEAGVLSFGQIVTWVDGTTIIQIVDLTNGTVMAEAPVSANPPQLTNVALQNPPTPVAGTVTLTWAASDPDGDPLTFDLAYSRDAGVTFHPIQVGITGDNIEIDMDTLGGGLGFFRLTASDGVHLAQATSPVYLVAAKPPQPYILSPGDSTVFQWGQPIHLNGIAYDLQEGILEEENLLWRLGNSLIALGTGSSVTLEPGALPVGTSEIRLIATNAASQTASESIIITIHDELAFPGPTLDVGPTALSWHVAPGTSTLQTGDLTVTNLGTGTLTWAVTTDAPWVTLSATSGTAPDTFTVTADPAGIINGQSWAAHITVNGYDAENQVVGTVLIPVNLSAGDIWLNQTYTIYLPLVERP
ncbi:MAG: BACON domain-containing carbohydrate-binding protein [Anaerolineales bacterium]